MEVIKNIIDQMVTELEMNNVSAFHPQVIYLSKEWFRNVEEFAHKGNLFTFKPGIMEIDRCSYKIIFLRANDTHPLFYKYIPEMFKLPQGKTGADRIYAERLEQLYKHKRTIEKDVMLNGKGQLLDMVMAIVTGDTDYCPTDWSQDAMDKIMQKSLCDKFAVAGAFLAAEIDRLDAEGK